MKEQRFFYSGAEDNEPTRPSDNNSNHESSLYGSKHNGIPSTKKERDTRTVEHNDFIGRDNTKEGTESTDYASGTTRPNAEVLVKEIDEQIYRIIVSNSKKYLKLWHSGSDSTPPIKEIQSDIFTQLYGNIQNPFDTDLIQTFTPERIRKIFLKTIND